MLSVPQKVEMPLKLLDMNGLHWQCVNVEKRGQLVDLYNRQLALPAQRGVVGFDTSGVCGCMRAGAAAATTTEVEGAAR